MNFKDLAATVELTEYCMTHGYSIVWCRWLDSILFTRESDEAELTPKPRVSASKIFKAVAEARYDESLDPLMDYLEPVKHPLQDSFI
ncbi:MAG: hypothetical protein MJZ26_02325 [Fibrobacter sp.]|nr:hypothetical protein [Fibrobacter sp.]